MGASVQKVGEVLNLEGGQGSPHTNPSHHHCKNPTHEEET